MVKYNGGLLTKTERKDSEYYIMRHGFHEYFKREDESHLTYKYQLFEDWAKANFPVCLRLVEKYENPYPELNIEKAQQIIKEQEMLAAYEKPDRQVITAYFRTYVGPQSCDLPRKVELPVSTDFFFIRSELIKMFELDSQVKVMFK